MRFIPYADTASIPNIVVDGPANGATVLALSHWARSGTPDALKADTSTEIVFNYHDTPRFHVDVEGVSNNHFDEDGLLGIFALLDPIAAARHRDLLIDASRAGDFGVYRRREAARLAFVVRACGDSAASPIPNDVFSLPRSEQAAALYREALHLLPQLIESLEPFRRFWQPEDARLSESERLIDEGTITLEEQPDLDLVIVRQPDTAPRYHPFAVHSRTPCSRVVLMHGDRIELQYRYEGWVQIVSRRPALRVDLQPLADRLNAQRDAPGNWRFDGVDDIEPRLFFEGEDVMGVTPEQVLTEIRQELRTGEPALNPYD